MPAHENLSPQQFRTRMPVSELLPHAGDRSSRSAQKHIEQLAENMGRIGFQTRKHGGMSGNDKVYPPSSPITLVHDDSGTALWEGNHRVHAASRAGLDTVPVLVKDFRTKRAG